MTLVIDTDLRIFTFISFWDKEKKVNQVVCWVYIFYFTHQFLAQDGVAGQEYPIASSFISEHGCEKQLISLQKLYYTVPFLLPDPLSTVVWINIEYLNKTNDRGINSNCVN